MDTETPVLSSKVMQLKFMKSRDEAPISVPKKEAWSLEHLLPKIGAEKMIRENRTQNTKELWDE